MTKRITAIFTALLLAAAMTISAFADSDTSDLDFDKKAVIDAWFLYNWEEHGGYREYEDCVGGCRIKLHKKENRVARKGCPVNAFSV